MTKPKKLLEQLKDRFGVVTSAHKQDLEKGFETVELPYSL